MLHLKAKAHTKRQNKEKLTIDQRFNLTASLTLYHKMQPGSHTTCGGKVPQPMPTKTTKRSDDLGKWKSECGLDDLEDTDQSKSDKGNAAEPDNEHLRTNSWTCS